MITTYRRAFAYFLHDWKCILALVALIILIVAFGALLAWPMAILLDVVLSAKPKSGVIYSLFEQAIPHSAAARIVALGVLFVLLKFSLDLLSCLRSMLANSIKYRGTLRVRRELFQHYHELGVPYHNARPLGDSLFRLSNDTFGPYGIFDTFFTTGQHAATLLTVTAVMFTRSIPLTLFALALAPLMLFGNRYFGGRIKLRADRSREIDAGLLTAMQRAFSSMHLTHAFNRRTRQEAHFDGAMSHSVDAAMGLHWQENLYPLFIQSIYGLGQAAVLGYGGMLVYQNQIANGPTDGFGYGDLLLIMSYFSQLLNPLSDVIGFGARVKTSVSASERVFTVLDEVPAVREAAGAVALSLKPRPLVLKNVAFAYAAETPILRGITARIEPGEMVAIVGVSGSGKSTLLNLLPRFFDPSEGSIALGRHDLRGVTLASLRQHIVIVSQENALVAGTLAENIALGNPLASTDQIQQAAERAGAAAFIEALPAGYDTQVAEGGKNFSGGQRQRLAIARALLTEASILVFDEPTSALDGETESRVMETINALKGEHTVILVTHRLQTASACDTVYKLERGNLTRLAPHSAWALQKAAVVTAPGVSRTCTLAEPAITASAFSPASLHGPHR